VTCRRLGPHGDLTSVAEEVFGREGVEGRENTIKKLNVANELDN
jgi:hypothetical protein